LTRLLQDFLNDPSASFRSLEQELLLKSILLKVPYILGVLPTSLGKTLTYLLSSSLSISKVTIVIIPLIGLKLDLLRRAKEYNIPCNIFEDTRTFNNLTLVSIETIVSSRFISLVEELINSSSLDRIIIDEVHLIISSSTYRSIMFRVRELFLLKVQFILLSGTLPSSFELELINSLNLFDLSIIRSDCCRLNISYRAKAYISNKEEERVLEIQEYINSFKVKEFLSLEDKIIIFCPSIKDIDLVATTLNCSKYYSSLSKEDKESTLNNFFNSKDKFFSILATSSSLEEGLDYSSIRLVVYKDIAYSFLGFLQGSSRSGRDNKPSTSIFFYNSSSLNKNISTSRTLSLLEQDKLLVNKYLLEETCRRRQISLYLDNKFKDSCSLNESLCDLCSNRSSIIDNQVNLVLDSSKKFELENIRIREEILKVEVKCLFCLFIDNIDINSIKHTSRECTIYSNIDQLSKNIRSLISKKEVLLKENSCCFKCLFLTKTCTYLKCSSSNCYNIKFMYRVLAILFINKDRLSLITKYSLRDNISLKEFLNKFLSKVFIKELNTEGTLGFYIFAFDS
jgi:superfamily II DNA helicase RecQ